LTLPTPEIDIDAHLQQSPRHWCHRSVKNIRFVISIWWWCGRGDVVFHLHAPLVVLYKQ